MSGERHWHSIYEGAPEGTKVEAWEGRIFTCSRYTSWDVSVAEGCKVTVSAVYLLKKRPGPPAAGPLYRILFCWSRLLYSASLGIWIFRGALRGSQILPALVSCFDWAVRRTYRTAWAVQPCCCSYSYGNGPAVGPQVSGNWEFLRGLWKAVAPLMAPWCADGEMPTCANLNLYEGSGSRVRWHSDNEGLFGRQGESKLIVSMSFGVSALFKWKPGPSLDSDALMVVGFFLILVALMSSFVMLGSLSFVVLVVVLLILLFLIGKLVVGFLVLVSSISLLF